MMLPPSWKSEVQKSVEEHANADREQRQTEQSDASTKIAAAISSLRDAQNTQTTHEDANQKTSVWLNSITIFLVFLTVIFTGLSWCAFHDQLTEMRKVYDPVVKSANAARDAADAAKQQVGVAIDTEQRQLRAYIVIDAANITKFEVGQLIQSHITLKNTGLTPAYDIDGYSAIMYDKFPLPYPFPTVSKQQYGIAEQRDVLGRNGIIHLFVPTKTVPLPDSFEAIRNGSMAVYVFGSLKYRDAFKQDRFTNWRLIYTKPDASGGLLGPLGKEGNEAN